MLISVLQFQLFFLALTRILAVIIHVPFLGGQNIPMQVRIALGVVLTVILVPWTAQPADAQSLGLLEFAVGIGKEIVIGSLAGYAAGLTFYVLEIAGEVMGLGSGFGAGRVFNPSMGESGSAFNQLFVMVSLLIFLMVDGHHLVIIGLDRTFDVIAVNGALPLDNLNKLASMTAQMIAAGVQIALPVMIALTLADVALGLLARVAPQVQIFFLGLPLKVGLSLFALGALFTVIFPALGNLFQQTGVRMLPLLQR